MTSDFLLVVVKCLLLFGRWGVNYAARLYIMICIYVYEKNLQSAQQYTHSRFWTLIELIIFRLFRCNKDLTDCILRPYPRFVKALFIEQISRATFNPNMRWGIFWTINSSHFHGTGKMTQWWVLYIYVVHSLTKFERQNSTKTSHQMHQTNGYSLHC